jgi:hypothetical protein
VLLGRVMIRVRVVMSYNVVSLGGRVVNFDVMHNLRWLSIVAAHMGRNVLHYMLHAILSGCPLRYPNASLQTV